MTLTSEATGERAAPTAGAPDARGPRGPRLSTVYTWVFGICGLAIGIRPLHDNSFMWHLRTGRLILDHGIPRHDPYSFTAPGTKWVAQSWLAELLYGVLNRVGGAFSLRMLGAIVGFAVGALLYRLCSRTANDRIRAGGITLLALAVMLNVWSERPLMLGILLMLALVYAVEIPDSMLGRHPMVVVPILIWLWANVHGTFVFGFAYLALHLLGRALEGRAPIRAHEGALLRASLLAGVLTLVNPYGLDLVLFPMRLMGRGEVLKNVSEWQSPSFRELGGMLFGGFVVCTMVLLARRRVGVRDLLIVVVFTVLGLWAVRNVGLAVVAIAPILGRLVHTDTPRPDERRPVHRLMVGVAVVALLVGVLQAAGERDWDLKRYPVAAFEAVQAQHLEGRHLLTTDAWGGYLIAHAWPEQQVFFDDRYDMYPIAVNEAYDTVSNVRPGWKNVLDEYGIDVVMWKPDSAFIQALDERPDWVKVYDDDTAVVYARRPVVAPAAH